MSSVKVHGEESDAALSESSKIAPQGAYAESKARAEDTLRGIAGLRLVVLRPPLVYGAGVRGNFLLLMRALARGLPLPLDGIANRRSLLYAGNLADAILRSLGNEAALGRSYLVCDGAGVSTPQLCRALGAALGRPARLFAVPLPLLELLPGAKRLTRSLELDDAALCRDLGWRAPLTFEQGLRAAARWYLTR
jgi:nucleoside-diphosphate-sugar epimerase